jgi:hypothetical protein
MTEKILNAKIKKNQQKIKLAKVVVYNHTQVTQVDWLQRNLYMKTLSRLAVK